MLQYSCLENPRDRGAGGRGGGYSPWACKESDMTEHTHTHTHSLTQFSLSKVGKLSPGDLCPILLLCYTGTRSMVLQVSLKFLNCCLNNAAPCIFWSQAEDVGKEGKRKESRAACFSLNLHQVPCRYPFMVVKLERNHFSRSPISPEAGV